MKGNALLKRGLLAVLVLSVILAVSCQPEVAWIRHNAVKSQMVEAGRGFADMKPVAKIVGNARIDSSVNSGRANRAVISGIEASPLSASLPPF
jgi:hypothetical protein